jgi:hypothetical protein
MNRKILYHDIYTSAKSLNLPAIKSVPEYDSKKILWQTKTTNINH